MPEDLCERLALLAEDESRTVSNMAKVLIQQGVERLELLRLQTGAKAAASGEGASPAPPAPPALACRLPPQQPIPRQPIPQHLLHRQRLHIPTFHLQTFRITTFHITTFHRRSFHRRLRRPQDHPPPPPGPERGGLDRARFPAPMPPPIASGPNWSGMKPTDPVACGACPAA